MNYCGIINNSNIETPRGYKPIQNLKFSDKIIGRTEDTIEMLWNKYFEGEIQTINNISGTNLKVFAKNNKNGDAGFYSFDELNLNDFVLFSKDFEEIPINKLEKSGFKGVVYYIKSSLNEVIINNCIFKLR